MDSRAAVMTLCAAPDFGPVTVTRLLQHFGQDAKQVLQASDDELRIALTPAKIRKLRHFRETFDADACAQRLAEMGARYVLKGEPLYPRHLATLSDAPPGIHLWGDNAEMPAINLAIVGTRHASAYGRRIARTWAQRLAGAGIGIISGMALGIDTEAHHGALEAGGFTAAVLGGGLDIVYPPENRALRDQIIAHGQVISEFHLGRRVDRQTFPQRNRLVSGMCDAVLVIESGARGGSLITARFAAEQGRTVMALPGRIDEQQTMGCHQLIRDGAVLVTSVEEVLEELRAGPTQLGLSFATEAAARTPEQPSPAAKTDLPPAEAALFAALRSHGPARPDELTAITGQDPAALQANAMLLELKGLLARNPDGRWDRAG